MSLAWATPAQSLDLTTYHVGGIRPKDTFNVQLYERNVQVAVKIDKSFSSLVLVVSAELRDKQTNTLLKNNVVNAMIVSYDEI